MRPLINKIKPANGFSRLAHVITNLVLVLIVFVLVRIEFAHLALALVLLSKWRMFVVRPRFWPALVRYNSIDVIVSVSLLVFMVNSDSQLLQLIWAGAYAFWLLVIKPASGPMMVSIQAMTGLFLGLSAIFLEWGDSPLYWMVAAAAIVCYLSARHFFDSFEEPYAKLLSYLWSFFAAALTLVLGHWLLFYGAIAQPTLLLVAVGYGLAALYYLDHHDKLSRLVRIEIMATTCAIVIAVIVSLTVNVVSTVRALLS
jgi:hypothetical protein